MPELPWEKWYPTNWAAEPGLRLCRAATRGIWFEALNTMMLSQAFEVSGTGDELCCLFSCIPVELTMALEQLKKHDVAEITEHNGNIILTSRKRKRDCEIRGLRSKAGRASATKRQRPPQHGASTPSVYASASASVPEGECKGEKVEFLEVEKQLISWFSRKPNQVLSYAEQSGIAEIARREDVKDEISELDNFRRQPKNYFPQSLQSLLSKWDETLDRARTHDARSANHAEPKSKSLLLKMSEQL